MPRSLPTAIIFIALSSSMGAGAPIVRGQLRAPAGEFQPARRFLEWMAGSTPEIAPVQLHRFAEGEKSAGARRTSAGDYGTCCRRNDGPFGVLSPAGATCFVFNRLRVSRRLTANGQLNADSGAISGCRFVSTFMSRSR